VTLGNEAEFRGPLRNRVLNELVAFQKMPLHLQVKFWAWRKSWGGFSGKDEMTGASFYPFFSEIHW